MQAASVIFAQGREDRPAGGGHVDEMGDEERGRTIGDLWTSRTSSGLTRTVHCGGSLVIVSFVPFFLMTCTVFNIDNNNNDNKQRCLSFNKYLFTECSSLRWKCVFHLIV